MAGTVAVKVTLGAIPQALVDSGRTVPRLMAAMSDAAVNAAGPYLWRQLALATPSGATGLLAQHATFERGTLGGVPTGFVHYSGAPSLYALWADQGRPPGKRPPNVVPGNPTAGMAYWAARKFGYPIGSKAAISAGFLVARSIGRKGSKGAHMVDNVIAGHRSKAEALMTRAAVRQLRSVLGATA